MNHFLEQYAQAAMTTFGFFWMALWAFILGYLISSMIQVFVTRERMKRTMGSGSGGKGVLLGTFFGFISSSCSFSALATTKSLFKKGASFMSSLAFLLASTNLVIELGIIISVFLGWQFVVGEYIGGVLLILVSWILVRIIKPKKLIEKARSHLKEDSDEHHHHSQVPDWKERATSTEGWRKVARKYWMEWDMVWKDVTIGFTLAGVIAAFVPASFFETMFIDSGSGDYDFLTLLQHVVIGPIAAFCTFIGSMGNIPLASLLYSNGVSFAGVMAFIFSDLVVFPVLRINAKYYGWKMSGFIVLLLFISLIVTSLSLHYGFDLMEILPETSGISASDQDHFKLNYTFFMNIGFLVISGVLGYLALTGKKHDHDHEMASKGKLEIVLKWLAYFSYLWLVGGLIAYFAVS